MSVMETAQRMGQSRNSRPNRLKRNMPAVTEKLACLINTQNRAKLKAVPSPTATPIDSRTSPNPPPDITNTQTPTNPRVTQHSAHQPDFSRNSSHDNSSIIKG